MKGTEKSIAVFLSGPIFSEVIDISATPSIRSRTKPFHSVFFRFKIDSKMMAYFTESYNRN